MMSVDWMGFAGASAAVVLAPGPGSLFVARSATTGGARAGRAAMLGIMLADTCLIALSLLGVSALLRAHPPIFHAVRLAGAGYLIVLGVQAILTKPKEQAAALQDTVLPLRRAFAITLLNPKAVFFFMAFFPVFIRSGAGGLVLPYAGMTVVFMGISVTYLCVLSEISARAGLAFQESRTAQSFARKVCGCLFVGFGVKVGVTLR